MHTRSLAIGVVWLITADVFLVLLLAAVAPWAARGALGWRRGSPGSADRLAALLERPRLDDFLDARAEEDQRRLLPRARECEGAHGGRVALEDGDAPAIEGRRDVTLMGRRGGTP